MPGESIRAYSTIVLSVLGVPYFTFPTNQLLLVLCPQVYIKYQCGGAPQVTHFYVLLYADRLLSRPVEVWQVGGGLGGVHVPMWLGC